MALQGNLRKQIQLLTFYNRTSYLGQSFSTTASVAKQKKKIVATKRLDSVGESIASKGFLRPHKSYEPPVNVNVAEKVQAICNALQIPAAFEQKLSNLEQKFQLLNACFKDFQHCVPNSQLHELHTVGDIISFYETAVDTTVPFDALKKIDLPENLHIQYDYLRFNPETDTKFGGQTAFPKSSTLVTGLKYRGKYAGHVAKRSWP